MDHLRSTHLYCERLPNINITSCGALEGATYSEQSFRRLVRWRAQLPWAEVRAGRICRRPGGAVSRFQSEAGTLNRRGRGNGKGETLGSD